MAGQGPGAGGPPPPPPPGGPPPPPGMPGSAAALPPELQAEKARIEEAASRLTGSDVDQWRERRRLQTEFQKSFKLKNDALARNALAFMDLVEGQGAVSAKVTGIRTSLQGGDTELTQADLMKLYSFAADEETTANNVRAMLEGGKDTHGIDHRGLIPEEQERAAKLIADKRALIADCDEQLREASHPAEEAMIITTKRECEAAIVKAEQEAAARERNLQQTLANAKQIIDSAGKMKDAAWRAQNPYKAVFKDLDMKQPEGAAEPGDAPAKFALTNDAALWDEVFSGYRLQNAIRFVAKDQDELDHMTKADVLAKFNEFATTTAGKKMDASAIIGIVSGFTQHKPFACNHLAPLRDVVIVEENRALCDFLETKYLGNNPELQPPQKGAGAGRTTVADHIQDMVEEAASPDAARDRRAEGAGAPAEAVQGGSGFMPGLRRVIAGRSGKDDADDNAASKTRPERWGFDDIERAREEAERLVREGDAAAGVAFGGRDNPTSAAVARMLTSNPKNDDEAALQLALAQSIAELPEGQVPPEIAALSKAKTQVLAARQATRIVQLEEKVQELETPENCLKSGGSLVDALKLFKEKEGRNPTTQDAQGIIQRGLPTKTGQLRRQIPAALAEVEDWKPGKKGPRM